MTRAYICSPLSAPEKAEIRNNMLQAREYGRMLTETYGYRTYAPHGYLPALLRDDCQEERELALSFDMELLRLCDMVIIFGNRISKGMHRELELAFELQKEVYYCQHGNSMQLFPVKDWRAIHEMQMEKDNFS